MSFLIIPLVWWQINIKWKKNMLFSERNGYGRCFVIFGVCFSLVTRKVWENGRYRKRKWADKW